MKHLHLQLPDCSYTIDIGQHCLDTQLCAFLTKHPYAQAIVVTNETIDALYPSLIEKTLSGLPMEVHTCVLPDGEQYKTWETLNQIFDFALEHHANRKTLFIAFGGGVIGDMTGFAAACFMRGVDFIQVPTTLLANVDSSVGGKTAINHPLGKNSIGAFKQPQYVCMDLLLLKTLPVRELKAGYLELIKHGIIHDAELFDWLEAHPIDFENLDYDQLEEAVFRSCQVKAHVVEQDEKEQGLRATLNFGHTLGHLIETHTHYQKYLHGEAVGLGMVFATQASYHWQLLSKENHDRILRLLAPYVPKLELPELSLETFCDLILHDKKSDKDSVNFIVVHDIGKSQIRKNVLPQELFSMFSDISR